MLIKPSKAAVKRYRERLRVEMRSLRGANAVMVLQRLTPIVRGWSAYYRTAVSSELFSALDRYLWRLTYKWARQTHPKKSKRWIVNRYFGRYNKVQKRPLGIRRPRQRRLPGQARWTKSSDT